jgi:transcriptional repressor NrdR
MKCPYCGYIDTEVVDSREVNEGRGIRRRRQCMSCKKRFTTYEHAEFDEITVIKKTKAREPFDRNKVLSGIIRACDKRSVSRDRMEEVADRIEMKIRSNGTKEIKSADIGDMVVKELFKLDPVAYIRFASVYQSFDSPEEFKKAVLLFKKKTTKKK